ncbi:hypothetical protein IEE94_11455 [Yimella sp. cx-573]|nr:hypothetical protein [Yimella sp. cx-573]
MMEGVREGTVQEREALRLLESYSDAATGRGPRDRAASSVSEAYRGAHAVAIAEEDEAADAALVAQLLEAMRGYHGPGVSEGEAKQALDRVIGKAVRRGRPWVEIPAAVAEECAALDALRRSKEMRR